LGKSPNEISNLESRQVIDAVTDVVAPIAGFVMQRKIGPGQYIDAGATDPVYVLANLSIVWLLASVKEADAPNVRIGQHISARVLAYPDREFAGTIHRIGSSIDPVTRRLEVMAEVENSENLLKPEMFVEFSIAIGPPRESSAVPVEALVREGDATRVWVQIAENRFAMRAVETGLQDHGMIEVLSGLQVGDRVVGKGSLFIDRAAQPN
jgi:cobalt-zinc-cadmium efflux system membrane fusion protein